MARLLIKLSQATWTQPEQEDLDLVKGNGFVRPLLISVWKGRSCISISNLEFCFTISVESLVTLLYFLLLLFIICTSYPEPK